MRAALWIGWVSLSLISCGSEERAPRSDEGRPIKMFTIGAATSGMEREYLGAVAAAQQVQLSFEVAGQVIEFPVDSGQQVSAGDVLAKLDPTNYEATRASAAAQVDAAKADVDRKRGLVDIGGVSRAAFEEAERRFTTAQSDLATAEKALRDTQLVAPFDGVVATTIADTFANVQAKEPILTLQDPTWMKIEVAVPEVDAALAIPGLTLVERNNRLDATVVVSAIPDREFDASISEFSTAADPVTHTYSATFVFPTPDDVSVLAGMSAHVRLLAKARDGKDLGFRVPVQSVAGDDHKNPYVWIIGADDKATKRPVKVGEIAGSMIEVLDGVSEGDCVALTGVHHLREGLGVRAWGAE